MIVEKKVDLLKSGCNIICHQVNCQGSMGSGLALTIKEYDPRVFDEYKKYIFEKGKRAVLGDTLFVNSKGFIVANVFGQEYYGYMGLYTDYKALEKGLRSVNKYAKANGLTVGIPYKMGCDRAGGDWEIVKELIATIFTEVDVTICKL